MFLRLRRVLQTLGKAIDSGSVCGGRSQRINTEDKAEAT
jgi:hypothetical protein